MLVLGWLFAASPFVWLLLLAAGELGPGNAVRGLVLLGAQAVLWTAGMSVLVVRCLARLRRL